MSRDADHQPCAEKRGGSEASHAALRISSEFAKVFMVLFSFKKSQTKQWQQQKSQFPLVLCDSTFIQSFQSLLEGGYRIQLNIKLHRHVGI